MGSTGYLAAVCLLATTMIYDVSVGARIEIAFKPSDPYFLPGSNVTVLCRAGVPLQSCQIKLPSVEEIIHLEDNTTLNSSEYANAGSNLEYGNCGVTLFNVQKKFFGDVICMGTPDEEEKEFSAKTTLLIARPPSAPEMNVTPSSSSQSPDYYKDVDPLEASCVVRGGLPKADITWFIGSDPFHTRNVKTVIDENNPNATRKDLISTIRWDFNNRELRCVVQHVTLGPKEVSQAVKKLTVRYSPRLSYEYNEAIEVTDVMVGQNVTLVVDVFANPRPSFIWTDGTTEIQIPEGTEDETGRLKAAMPKYINATGSSDKKEDHDKWRAELYVTPLNESDFDEDHFFFLNARNSEGEQDFTVVVIMKTEPEEIATTEQAMEPPVWNTTTRKLDEGNNTDMEPAVGDRTRILGAGGISGIVITLVVLLVIIILITFARVTSRWCFAGRAETQYTPGETEDFEAGNNGTLVILEDLTQPK